MFFFLIIMAVFFFFFFFQAEDGIRDYKVTGVQTCALPIWIRTVRACAHVGSVDHRRNAFDRAEFESAKLGERDEADSNSKSVCTRWFSGPPQKRVRPRRVRIREVGLGVSRGISLGFFMNPKTPKPRGQKALTPGASVVASPPVKGGDADRRGSDPTEDPARTL